MSRWGKGIKVFNRKDDIQQVGDDWVTVGRLIPQR